MVNTVIYKFLDRYPYYWLGFCLIFLVFGLGLMTMGVVIQSEDRTVQVSGSETEFVSSSVEYSAVAQNNTTAYETGRELVGSPLYTQDEYPILDVSYTTNSERNVDANTRVVVEYKGVQQGFEFWNQTRVVSEHNYDVNGTNSGVISVNMTDITSRAFSIRESFDNQGQVQVRIVVITEYASDTYNGSVTIESDLLFTESTYSVTPPEDSTEVAESVAIVRNVQDSLHSVFLNYGGGILLIAGLFYLAHMLSDPRRVMNDYMLMKHNDWITDVDNVEYNSEYDCTVDVQSPSDLVNLAADTGGRIMWDEDMERYQIVNDGMVCTYELDEEDKLTVRGTRPGEYGRPSSSRED